MTWQPTVPSPDTEGQDSDYLTWEDGDTKTFTILSDQPKYHSMHWVSGQPKPCTGANCAWCTTGVRVSSRYTVRVELDGDQKLWEMAGLTWKDLSEKAIMAEQLRGLLLKVKRKGVKRNTRYVTFISETLDPDTVPEPKPFEPGITDSNDTSSADPKLKYQQELSYVQQNLDGATTNIKQLCEQAGITMEDLLSRTTGFFGSYYHQQNSNHKLAMLLFRAKHYATEDNINDEPASESLKALIG